MAAGGKLMRQDETGIWLYLTLAAKKAGMSKEKLMQKAGSGELAYRDDLPGKFWWFREHEIAALAKANYEAKREQPAKPKRKKTEKELARAIGAQLTKHPPRKGGVMTSHAERLTLPRDERIPKGQR
ncbi:MAG: hypothetical protein ACXIT4_00790 [Erythrobacter sp.]